jgi:hypothetical protein
VEDGERSSGETTLVGNHEKVHNGVQNGYHAVNTNGAGTSKDVSTETASPKAATLSKRKLSASPALGS